MPSTFTVPGASIKPTEAAKQLRLIIRGRYDMGKAGGDASKISAPYGWEVYEGSLATAIEQARKSTRNKKTQAALDLIEARIESDRNRKRSRLDMVINAANSKPNGGETFITWEDLVKMYGLIQHIPTSEDLPPANKPETTLRAIHAVLKNSGVNFDEKEGDDAPKQEEEQEPVFDEDYAGEGDED